MRVIATCVKSSAKKVLKSGTMPVVTGKLDARCVPSGQSAATRAETFDQTSSLVCRKFAVDVGPLVDVHASILIKANAPQMAAAGHLVQWQTARESEWSL